MESVLPDENAVEWSKEAVLRHYVSFSDAMTSTGSVDRLIAEEAVRRLYKLSAMPPPAIIWCKSFYQMLTMPSLLIGLLHSDIWDLVAGVQITQTSLDEWTQYWDRIWPEIWIGGGESLLTGMNRTSTISEHYGDLEGALITQAKEEFGRNLYAGRLGRLQQGLGREIYRRFWTPLRHEIARTGWTQLLHDIYSGMDYLRNNFPDWPYWQTVSECDRSSSDLGVQVSSSFRTLANRLGGEPAGQAGLTVYLPADIPWLATANLLLEVWPDHFSSLKEQIKIWSDIAEHASAIMCLEGLTFICEKPDAFRIDEQLRLHSAVGPALSYSDGFSEYAWEGVLVPSTIIENPKSITVEAIESCLNVAVRRVMLEQYGVARYMIDAQVAPIQEDQFGILLRREMPGEEDLVLLKVINSSAEPDGTFREYFLRVPPDVATARQAVAWTFGMKEEDYDPNEQT